MPIPAALIPLIGALAGGAMSLGGNIGSNRANRRLAEMQNQWNIEQWSRENTENQRWWNQQNEYDQFRWNQQNMYNEGQWRRENAYNEKLWHMQNKYNSPIEQMARFKEAGLNPHLIYGKGTAGQANQVVTGSMRAGMAESNGMQSPDVKGYTRANMESVTRGLDVFGQYTQLKNIQAQTNNVEAATDNAKEDRILKQQEQALKVLGIGRGKLSFRQEKELYDTQVDIAREQLKKTRQEIKESAKRIGKIDVDTLLGKESLKLRKHGVTESDNVLLRAIIKGLKNNKIGIPGLNF